MAAVHLEKLPVESPPVQLERKRSVGRDARRRSRGTISGERAVALPTSALLAEVDNSSFEKKGQM